MTADYLPLLRPSDPQTTYLAAQHTAAKEGRRISLQQCIVIIVTVDVVSIIGTNLLSTLFERATAFRDGAIFDKKLVITLCAASLYSLVAIALGAYDSRRILERRHSIVKMCWALGITFALLTALGAATKTSDAYSRIWFFSWASLAFFMVPALRLVALAFIRKRLQDGAFFFRAASVGIFSDPLSPAEIAERSESRIRVGYTLRLRDLQQLEKLADTIAHEEIDKIFIVTPWTDAPAAFEAAQSLRHLSAEIVILPEDRRIASRHGRFSLQAVNPPLDDWGLWLKRAQDLMVSTTALLILAPVMAAIAVAIKLECPGPILFRQQRVGFNGRTFELLKFRSMVPTKADADAVRQTAREDERVTRVGRIIRRTSLDESPQFFNVLQGAMSVVGPRPHALKTRAGGHVLHEAADSYFARHRMKPGLTGLAQVNGFRGELDTVEKLRQRLRCDIEYIDNWSTWLDLKIILQTALLIIHDPRAY